MKLGRSSNGPDSFRFRSASEEWSALKATKSVLKPTSYHSYNDFSSSTCRRGCNLCRTHEPAEGSVLRTVLRSRHHTRESRRIGLQQFHPITSYTNRPTTKPIRTTDTLLTGGYRVGAICRSTIHSDGRWVTQSSGEYLLSIVIG